MMEQYDKDEKCKLAEYGGFEDEEQYFQGTENPVNVGENPLEPELRMEPQVQVVKREDEKYDGALKD